ncbi:hypothetical protein AXG93_3255s1090 [Marchantia polymorpha subsp. ruderalis]|uniref:Uncharacterized protein n=3 Tax=Marchantia polymorpha TaxID=3197 RepID=A0A176VQ49_MARPO|nr:hypothetical protein AXG93_3255s1090 [Marchantia polymorpha subsp. ruderalis]
MTSRSNTGIKSQRRTLTLARTVHPNSCWSRSMAARAMAVAGPVALVGSGCTAFHAKESCKRAVAVSASATASPSSSSFSSCRVERVLSPGLLQNNSWQPAATSVAWICPRSTDGFQLRAAASDAEIPEEILEDSKFVPLNDDDPRFGPAVLFLLGFGNNQGAQVLEMLREMEGDFLKVVLCTPEMIKGTLGQAVNTPQPDITTVRVAKGLPPICFLSGLTGEEIMMLIQAFRDSGMEDTVFAAHVPKNTDKSLEELIEEIMGDHERLSKAREPTPA